jgi:hypothetical protein
MLGFVVVDGDEIPVIRHGQHRQQIETEYKDDGGLRASLVRDDDGASLLTRRRSAST